jgi:hypothetical protein
LNFKNIEKIKAIMSIENLNTIKDLEHFIQSNETELLPVLGDKQERYRFIQKILVKFGYITLNKAEKGIVNRYIRTVSGYSRQQLTRLIKQYKDKGYIQWQLCRSNGFSTIYSLNDIKLLVEMDTRHEDICGHAIKKLMERAYHIYEQQEYHTLANISVSHLYNLRSSQAYQKQRKKLTKTQPRQIAIGKRRKPQSNGQPGYIRIDTVLQDYLDGHKDVYHINAIDEMTQFEVVCSVEQISKHYLIPVLEQMLTAFPFMIKEFHLDNSSEQINKYICKLLTKLQLELGNFPPLYSNNSDNTLSQNNEVYVVRKQRDNQQLSNQWIPMMNKFNVKYLFSYINYHRPCFFPVVILNKKGQLIKTYPYENMMTPYERLKSLPNAKTYLKPGVYFEKLDKQVMAITDNACAESLQKERSKLCNLILKKNKPRNSITSDLSIISLRPSL